MNNPSNVFGGLSRRQWLRRMSVGVLGASACPWLPALAAAAQPKPGKHCVLLWMPGGPAQTDTFDMKPNHANGGEFKEAATSVPGLRFSEHLPQLAQQAEHLALIRSLSTKEGDHGRGSYLMRTGRQPGGPVRFPTLGSIVSKELGDSEARLPNYISINPGPAVNAAAFGPGYLGPRYAPATVGGGAGQNAVPAADGFAELGVDNLTLPKNVSAEQHQKRLEMWRSLQSRFLASRSSGNSRAQNTMFRRAVRMMHDDAVAAFDLSQEPDAVREAYGRGTFGQGCLMARRLIERGAPFVEVSLGTGLGWDTHLNNFPAVKSLSAQLDAGWATLMRELADRGLLESTTILWMGEFGRTPTINGNAGRDHFPAAWTCVLAGGGIAGGQAFGRTSDDGSAVEDGKVDEGSVLATFCRAAGIDPAVEIISSIGRPFPIMEGEPIADLLA